MKYPIDRKERIIINGLKQTIHIWGTKPENPVVLFLHGAGERGADNAAQLKHGVADLVAWLDKNEKGFRFVAGQVPVGKRWVEVDWNAPRHTMPAEPSETMALALQLLEFPGAVVRAAEAYKPSVLADYLFQTAQLYSSFYQSTPVLKSEEPARSSRLALCALFGDVLRLGLSLLGIETPDHI